MNNDSIVSKILFSKDNINKLHTLYKIDDNYNCFLLNNLNKIPNVCYVLNYLLSEKILEINDYEFIQFINKAFICGTLARRQKAIKTILNYHWSHIDLFNENLIKYCQKQRDDITVYLYNYRTKNKIELPFEIVDLIMSFIFN